MLRPDLGLARERRDRLGDPRCPCPAAPGQREPVDGACEQIAGFGGQTGRMPAELRPRDDHPLADVRGRLAGRRSELCRSRARHHHDEVAAIEERSREPLAVPRQALRRAGAVERWVSASATRTEIHRCDELESGGEQHPPEHPRDEDEPVLERLAQRLERRALKLAELVEEQDASMGEARLTRPRTRAAARRLPPSTRSDGEL